MYPTNDVLFKKIFGADGNEHITKDLVSSIIGKKIAYEELQKLNSNEAEREIAERRYMDLVSLEYAKKYERKEGINQGKKEKEREIAKKMLKKSFEISVISELTGLTKEEIENLK